MGFKLVWSVGKVLLVYFGKVIDFPMWTWL